MAPAALVLVMSGLAAATAGAATVPPPLVSVPTPSTAVVSSVLGVLPSGDTFISANDALGVPAAFVLHPDGTRHLLEDSHYVTSNGTVGPDGRFWAARSGTLKAWDVAGADTTYPLPTPSGGSIPAIFDVRVSPDGRIWAADVRNDQVISLDVDGSDPVAHDLPDRFALLNLALGPDGRIWASGTGGQVVAFSADGTRTAYPAGPASPSRMAAFDGSLWVVGAVDGLGGSLVRIDPDGTRSTVTRLPGVINRLAVRGMAVANGRLWIADDKDTLTGIDADGAVRTVPVPTSFGGSFGDGFSMSATPSGDLVGSAYGSLWRLDDPVPGPQLSATAVLVPGPGTSTLRVAVSARTADLEPLPGPVDISLWWRRFPARTSIVPTAAGRSLVRRVVVGADGTASVDVLLRTGVVPAPALTGGILRCCQVAVELPGAAGAPGVSARRVDVVGAPDRTLVVPEPTRYLDAMNQAALGRPMDEAGLRYWAKRLAEGTPKVTPVRAVVATQSWRNRRVTDAYLRWLGRAPDPGGLAYWSRYLSTHTTAELDRALGSSPAARDAEGTSNAARAAHLSKALGLSPKSDASFEARLDAGVPWSVVLRDGYGSFYAEQSRVRRLLGPSGLVGSHEDRLIALLHRTGDERALLIDRLPSA